MSALGGSVVEVSLDSRLFAPGADDDAKIAIGGKTNDVSPNGNGTAVLVQTITPASVENINLAIDHDKGDLEALQALADRPSFWPFAVTLADGTTWQGRAQITDLPALSTKSARADVKFKFEGKLTRQ